MSDSELYAALLPICVVIKTVPIIFCNISNYPGFKNGCKAAVIAPDGSVLLTGVFHPDFRRQPALVHKERSQFVDAVKVHGVRRASRFPDILR